MTGQPTRALPWARDVPGLSRRGDRLLRAARRRQPRAFWQANKATYEAAVKEPMEELCRGARRLRSVPHLPAVQRSALLQEPAAVQDGPGRRHPGRGRTGYYLQHLGRGTDRGRRLLHDGEGSARTVPGCGRRRGQRHRAAELVDALRRAGYAIGAHDELKTAPRGYSQDHPRIVVAAALGTDGVAVVAGRQVDAHEEGGDPVGRRGTASASCAAARHPRRPEHAAPGRRADDLRWRRSDHAWRALEGQLGLADRVVDDEALANSVARFREQGITLPTFAELADPTTFDAGVVGRQPTRRLPTPATSGASTGTTISPAGASRFPSTSCCRPSLTGV